MQIDSWYFNVYNKAVIYALIVCSKSTMQRVPFPSRSTQATENVQFWELPTSPKVSEEKIH